ncbi:hypothetical protein ICM05_09735 [Leucobacter sp. cx-42]|uniref:hypothetical protein n=1 Tax=unclassified Leucobacter TaxID=2621730 RepID=UPI00165EA9C4|nr:MULTISPECIES: hypothetical protein [unclassified Leucobacter]MBC9954918.1 hypothetical protein [Leucobacter sp. cx-42]
MEVTPLDLQPELLERVTAYAKKWQRGKSIRFISGKSDNPYRPAALRVTVGNFDGLIQPTLLTR